MVSFWSIFLFSSVMYLQYTPSSKRNLYSKINPQSEATYSFHISKAVEAARLRRWKSDFSPHNHQVAAGCFLLETAVPDVD